MVHHIVGGKARLNCFSYRWYGIQSRLPFFFFAFLGLPPDLTPFTPQAWEQLISLDLPVEVIYFPSYIK